MKNVFYFTLLLFALLSCSKDQESLKTEMVQVRLGIEVESGHTRAGECMDLNSLKSLSEENRLTASITIHKANTNSEEVKNNIPVKFITGEDSFYLSLIELPVGANQLLSITIFADETPVYEGVDSDHILSAMISHTLPYNLTIGDGDKYQIKDFQISVVCSETLSSAEFGFGYIGLEIYASYQLEFFVGACDETGKIIPGEGVLTMDHLKRDDENSDWKTAANNIYSKSYPVENALPSFAFADMMKVNDQLEGYRFSFTHSDRVYVHEMSVKELLESVKIIRESEFKYVYVDLCSADDIIGWQER